MADSNMEPNGDIPEMSQGTNMADNYKRLQGSLVKDVLRQAEGQGDTELGVQENIAKTDLGPKAGLAERDLEPEGNMAGRDAEPKGTIPKIELEQQTSMADRRLGQKLLEKHLSCPVCYEVMLVPKILPCHHRVCLTCLALMLDDNSKINCPIDRSHHHARYGDAQGFPTDFLLSSIAQDIIKDTSYQLMQRPHLPGCVFNTTMYIDFLTDIQTMALTPTGQLWVADGRKNCILDKVTWEIEKKDNTIFVRFCSFRDSTYAIKYGFCLDQLNLYNSKGEKIQSIDFPFDSLNQLTIDGEETLYIVSPEQPYVIYSKPKGGEHFHPWLACDGKVLDICCTRENDIILVKVVEDSEDRNMLCMYDKGKKTEMEL